MVSAARLLPLAVPLNEMTDYTSVRVSFNAMLSAEGFKELWTVGQEPPASVVEWWGANDWDIFALRDQCKHNQDHSLSLQRLLLHWLPEVKIEGVHDNQSNWREARIELNHIAWYHMLL